MSKQEFDKVASMNDQRYKELLTEGKIEPVERLIKEWHVNYDVIKVSQNILFLYVPSANSECVRQWTTTSSGAKRSGKASVSLLCYFLTSK